MVLTPQNDAINQADQIWELVERVLANEALLSEIGFAARDTVEQAVVFLRAGDRLHPTKGYDFLGPEWRILDKAAVIDLLNERDEAVEEIVREFVGVLKTRGYDAAYQFAASASRYQTLYVSRSRLETAQRVQEMFDRGLGIRELSDNFMEKVEGSLVFGYDESISYYMLSEMTSEADSAR